MVKKLKVIDNLRNQVDVAKVFDDEGIVRMGKEAVGVWQKYLEELPNGGKEGAEEVHSGRESFEFIDFKKAYDRVGRIKLWSCLEGAGLEGRMVEFLSAAYQECKCEVKGGDMVSGSFDVMKDLRQGCVLLPVLFSLYINSLVNRLREAGIGVEFRGQRIPVLLYADDMVLLTRC